MSLIFSDFKKNLEKKFYYERNPRIAVGVSGGPDSLALCILLKKWVKNKKGKLIALIINHNIRKESLSESNKTKKFLNSKNIDCKILSIYKKKVKTGKQSESRVNRFEKLINYCQKNYFFHLFLGHHFDDNIETFILRKIAGSNFEGLNSMQFISIFKSIQIVRPLLLYNKEDIIFYNKKYKIPFLLDPSNQNVKYSRVAIREFLKSNKKMKKEIIGEFSLIKNNYNLYIKMIFQILNLIILRINFKKIILNSKLFFNLDSEIKVKILIKCIQYVQSLNINIRIIKIQKLLLKISKSENILLKTNNVIINRIEGKIIIRNS